MPKGPADWLAIAVGEKEELKRAELLGVGREKRSLLKSRVAPAVDRQTFPLQHKLQRQDKT